MLKPAKMNKIQVICLKPVASRLIKSLQARGVVHLGDHSIPEVGRAGVMPSFDEVSLRTTKLRSIMEALGGEDKPQVPKKRIEIQDPVVEADSLIKETESLFSLMKEKEGVLRDIDANISLQKPLSELEDVDIDFSRLVSSSEEHLKFFLLKASNDKAKAAAISLSKKKHSSFAAYPSKGNSSILLVALPKSEDTKFIEHFGQTLSLPKIPSTPRNELEKYRQDERHLREKLSSLEGRIGSLRAKLMPRLLALEEALSIESERSRISIMFGATASLYFIEGWAEPSAITSLRSDLKAEFGKKVLLIEREAGPHDTPPTKLKNPKQASSFQYFVEFLSTPNYHEIDPSIIIAISIPLIYALIFGDAGYALISFIIATLLMRVSKKGTLLHEVASIWQIAAIPTFLVGIAFDEYFGFTHSHLLSVLGFGHVQLYEGFHRIASITSLMLITIYVGMAHLALGFIIGAINEWGHNKKHAAAKICWLLIEFSGFFVAAGFMFNAYPAFFMPSLVVFILSVLGLIATEGPIAAIEIPGLASNIMSYLRIAAVGVGGVILAEAINELLLPRLDMSPMGILVFMLISLLYVVAHIGACVLAMFEAFVHGARLQVVEFFGKFYKSNGIKFSPFSEKRVYTKES